jgi:hypothetical protein
MVRAVLALQRAAYRFVLIGKTGCELWFVRSLPVQRGMSCCIGSVTRLAKWLDESMFEAPESSRLSSSVGRGQRAPDAGSRETDRRSRTNTKRRGTMNFTYCKLGASYVYAAR